MHNPEWHVSNATFVCGEGFSVGRIRQLLAITAMAAIGATLPPERVPAKDRNPPFCDICCMAQAISREYAAFAF